MGVEKYLSLMDILNQLLSGGGTMVVNVLDVAHASEKGFTHKCEWFPTKSLVLLLKSPCFLLGKSPFRTVGPPKFFQGNL